MTPPPSPASAPSRARATAPTAAPARRQRATARAAATTTTTCASARTRATARITPAAGGEPASPLVRASLFFSNASCLARAGPRETTAKCRRRRRLPPAAAPLALIDDVERLRARPPPQRPHQLPPRPGRHRRVAGRRLAQCLDRRQRGRRHLAGQHQLVRGAVDVDGGSVPSRGLPTSFYNDSSDSLSVASQLSPALPSSATFGGASASSASASAAPFHAGAPSAAAAGLAGPARPFAAPQPPLGPGAPHESPDAAYFSPDARRPSVASVTTTASSQGSKASVTRGGFRKLQGFFGEEFPGRDSSESSLPISLGKDQRSRSYSHTRPSHRDRNYSNATDPRDASPSSSRPRTPVPAPEVVPFLYQDNTDIARYGEAPVRDFMTGPDRERYASTESTTSQVPPKSSSSARSGGVHLPGHHYHRHNKSNEDPRTLRPSVSREDTLATSYPRERGPSVPMNIQRSGHADGQTSPGHHGKRGLLGRLRRHKDKDDGSKLRDMPSSTRSLQPKGSRADISRADMSPSPFPGAYWPSASDMSDSQDPRAAAQRAATFNNKFPFSKKGRTQRGIDYTEEAIGPTDRNDPGHVYHLDTNLNDMEGILTKPPQLPPMDVSFVNSLYGDRKESLAEPKGGWDAPDSWAVRRGTEERSNHTTDVDEIGSPPRPEEKLAPYFIRIFRSDGTFSTHSMALDSTVTDVISQVVKKTYVVDGLENYHIIMKKHDLIRVLTPPERPLLMQKRLLQQVGYEEKDRIEELGREDNGYLCRFMFLSARESDFHARTTDLGITRSQKLNYVDLSGRNLVTIPISLYLKASDIISLNLSRNLSLDVPRDFIQSCKHLRDIKFTNNEARKLPLSLGRAGKLTYLDISNNRVEQLEHAELGGLTGLLKMNLANNRLTHLPRPLARIRR
ncbi:hypothetical protein ACCO45_003310 [Purpureocillium lilacinum]|uniref:Uncharacterized protein n=1 Tax=Purpureocillium lilacinum TaxID=33203 RepID=A0ACC4E0V6_PURLI